MWKKHTVQSSILQPQNASENSPLLEAPVVFKYVVWIGGLFSICLNLKVGGAWPVGKAGGLIVAKKA